MSEGVQLRREQEHSVVGWLLVTTGEEGVKEARHVCDKDNIRN